MTAAPMMLSLADIARLADVQRPVASMWRTRFRGTAHPFPPAVTRRGNQDLFDADTVAAWLEATGRGNNPEAARDAAAYQATAHLDVAELTAALALRTLAGHSLAGTPVEDLLDLADEIDPDDAFLFGELDAAADRLIELAERADRMADAAYSPGDAFEKIVRERFRTGLDDSARTGLSEELLALAAQAALTMAESTGAERFLEATPGGSDLLLAVVHALGETGRASLGVVGSSPAQDAAPSHRLARRRLAVATAVRDDFTAESGPLDTSAANPGLFLAQLPGPAAPEADAAEILRAIDELALSLAEHDAGLVIGPSRVLSERLTGEAELQRSQTLRLGRVRAVVRLGAGLAPARVRQPLALWVIGADQRDLPIAERRTMVADLGSAVLNATTRQDLISDLAASLGGSREVHAHAFRFGRLVPTSTLVADGGPLTARSRQAVPGGAAVPDPDILVRAERLLEDITAQGLPGDRQVTGRGALPLTLGAGTHRPAKWTTVDTLLADGSLRYLPGTRLREDELGPQGLRVLDAAPPGPSRGRELGEEAGEHPGDIGRVDHWWFAAHHAGAQLTEPGDVVFRTGPIPSAVVDRIGSAVVRTPSRVLRITPGSGLAPEVLVEDLASAPAGSWRTCPARRFAPGTAQHLTTALENLAEARDALERQLGRLHDLSTLIITGTATGDLRVASAPTVRDTEGNA